MKKIIIVIIAVALLSLAAFAGLLYIKSAENKVEEVAKQKEEIKKEQELERQQKKEEQLQYNLANHVYSHRGASSEEIEHTIAAYDKAIEEGSHNIEQDIVMSAEGTLYVSHDLTSNRIAGSGGSFSSMSNQQIDQLKTSDGQNILKLSDVFERYKKSVNYIIELKSYDSKIIAEFKNVVDKYGMKDNIVVQCFELETLKQLESYYPEMPKLHLSKTQASFENAASKDYVDILAVEKSMMTESNCDFAHDNKKKFNVWTIDSESEIITAINLGVDSYFTNCTDLAISLEREYRDEEKYQEELKERLTEKNEKE